MLKTLSIQVFMTKNQIIFFFLFLSASAVFGQKIDAAKIKSHITTLAGDDYEGRGTGSAGEKKANDYIELQIVLRSRDYVTKAHASFSNFPAASCYANRSGAILKA